MIADLSLHFTRPRSVHCQDAGPPSMPSIVVCLMLSCSRLFLPFFVMSPYHVLLRFPFDIFPLLDCHSVQRLVHLLSFILARLFSSFPFLFQYISCDVRMSELAYCHDMLDKDKFLHLSQTSKMQVS